MQNQVSPGPHVASMRSFRACVLFCGLTVWVLVVWTMKLDSWVDRHRLTFTATPASEPDGPFPTTLMYNLFPKPPPPSRSLAQQVDCSRLFAGPTHYAAHVMKYYTGFRWAETHYSQALEDYLSGLEPGSCETLLASRQYPCQAPSEEEAAFPIAFSILLYKDVDRVERLLRAIYRPHNVYCLHVDGKAPSGVHRATAGLANCFNNVFVASRLVDVVWGHFSVLEADLICMQDLLTKHATWKYFINLTGQEFPLKTNVELVRILSVYNGANDIFAYSARYVRCTDNEPVG